MPTATKGNTMKGLCQGFEKNAVFSPLFITIIAEQN